MKKLLLVASLCLLLYSCSYKTFPLKGTYSTGNFEGVSEKSRDEVWDNIIDFYAKKGLAIRIIDKASGYISSTNSRLISTHESPKGGLVDPAAWVVTSKTIDPGSNRPFKEDVAGEWNIRIKPTQGKKHSSTSI